MTFQPLSPIRQAWYRWKALRLPWRKRFFVGLDLQNNTFWEFRDGLGPSHRMRRIVKSPSAVQYSDLKVSPQWHQWLRYMRDDVPTLAELGRDVVRQEQLKVLARQADERWAAKSSLLDRPGGQRAQLPPTMQTQDLGEPAESTETVIAEKEGVTRQEARLVDTVDTKQALMNTQAGDIRSQPAKGEPREDPWKQTRGGPSEEWQPKAWSPDLAAKR